MSSNDDEIAEEARRLAKERSFSARRFLGVLDRGYYTDVDVANVPEEATRSFAACVARNGGSAQRNCSPQCRAGLDRFR